jgi:hypothetical protein
MESDCRKQRMKEDNDFLSNRQILSSFRLSGEFSQISFSQAWHKIFLRQSLLFACTRSL